MHGMDGWRSGRAGEFKAALIKSAGPWGVKRLL